MDTQKTLQEQHDRYIYCRDEGHLQYQKKARQCEDFFAGDQWDEATKQKLRNARRPALTLNKTLSSMMVLFSEQLKNRASINFVPLQNGTQDTANTLNKLWLYTAARNRLKWVESQVFDDGVITGRGYYDIRMNFDDNIMGEVKILPINPMNVIIDPDAELYDPDDWHDVFYSKWLSLDEIGRMYGQAKKKRVKNTVGHTFPLGYDYADYRPDTFGGYEDERSKRYTETMQDYRKRVRVLERQYKVEKVQDHFVDMETGDMSVVPPDMPREKIQAVLQEFNVNIIKRKTNIVRWTVTAGDTVLHHEESPYKHFTIVPFFPIFRRGTTIGMVENLIDPQELYNKARSQELHVINTSANSGWITKQGNVTNMDREELEERGAESGLILEVADVNDTIKISPNQIPSGLDRVSQVAGDDLKEISMASDSMRGFDREDVAAKAIQAKQQVGGKNFAKVMDNLSHTRNILAMRTLELMQTFYTTSREFQITGEGLNAQSEQVQINQMQDPNMPVEEGEEPPPEGILNDITVGKYDVTVTTVPDRDTMQQTQLEQAIQLKELGVPIPDSILLQNSTLEDKEEILQELTEKPDPMQEEMKKLEVELKRLENEKAQAEVDKLQSEAALNLVRAQRDSEDAQNKAAEDPNAGNGQAETGPTPLEVQEAELNKVKTLRELDMKELEIESNIELKREELRLKRVESSRKNVTELKKIDQQADAAQLSAKAAAQKPQPAEKKNATGSK